MTEFLQGLGLGTLLGIPVGAGWYYAIDIRQRRRRFVAEIKRYPPPEQAAMFRIIRRPYDWATDKKKERQDAP